MVTSGVIDSKDSGWLFSWGIFLIKKQNGETSDGEDK